MEVILIILSTVLLINILITALLAYNFPKLIKMILGNDGVPLSQTFPINLKNFKLTSKYNGFLCLDIECNSCQKILKDLYTGEKTFARINIIFLSNEQETISYLNNHNYKLDLYQYSFSNLEELYLKSKPFLFILNDKNIVMDKYLVNDTKLLDNIL